MERPAGAAHGRGGVLPALAFVTLACESIALGGRLATAGLGVSLRSDRALVRLACVKCKYRRRGSSVSSDAPHFR